MNTVADMKIDYIAIDNRQIVATGTTLDECRENAAAICINTNDAVTIYKLVGMTRPVRTYEYLDFEQEAQ